MHRKPPLQTRLRRALRSALVAPPPQTLLRAVQTHMPPAPPARIGFFHFVLRQVRFVPLSAWLLQCAVLAGAALLLLYAGERFSGSGLYAPLLCCCGVLLALSGAWFYRTAGRTGMLEVEMSSRFSSPRLLLARLFTMGVCHTAALGGLLVLARHGLGGAHALCGLLTLLLLPYLLALLGCVAVHTLLPARGSAATVCVLLCALLAAAALGLHRWAPGVYAAGLAGVWAALSAVAALALAGQVTAAVRRAATLDTLCRAA